MLAELWLIGELAVGTIFLLSTLGKLSSPFSFARSLRQYEVIPPKLTYPLGVALIVLEGFVAGSHLSGLLLPIAIPITLVLLLLMGIAVAINLYRGRAVPCYCFGVNGDEKISGKTIFRLHLLFLMEVFLAAQPHLFGSNWPEYRRSGIKGQQYAAALLSAMILLLFASWLVNARDLSVLVKSQIRIFMSRSSKASVSDGV